MANTITLEQLINRTYKALWQNSEAINITADDVVIPKINSVIDRVCKGNVKDLLTWQVYNCGDLSFLRKKVFYNIIKSSVLSEDIAVWDTVAKFDATDFSTSWAVIINGEVIKYTNKISTEIQGLTVLTSHKVGSTVRQLYNMPSDISNPFTIFNTDNSWSEKEIRYKDDRYWGIGIYYTVVQNNDWDRYFHFQWLDYTGSKISLYYYITATTLSNLSDICIIPDTYCYDMIPLLVAWEIALENEEDSDAQSKLRMWYSKLSEMYAYYSKINKPNRQQFIIQPRNFSSIMWYGRRR